MADAANPKRLRITDVVLRDAHQSILATRMRIEDMLPIAEKLDQVGYWSVESWGGATFDSCIRYLGEDPWERLRQLKAAMPNTPQQMLLRAQNLLGYRHYADDVVHKFIERAAANGMDVFRIFDAMNDLRNFETAVAATIANERHAQGTMSYTVSPVHSMDMWVDMGRRLEDMGCHSLCIKDMAGLLRPYVAHDLVSRLKKHCQIPVTLHCHATTGLSTATLVKAVEAGADMVDASISSMSMTYGHSATESIVAIFEGRDRDTGLDINLLEEISGYFRAVRKKYAAFEGALRGVDSRILTAQVPGGMLTNLESQLKEQNAAEKLDEVLEEIPRVRKDLGYIPLVTPTSQIVGTQSVINVLTGERYKSITKETAGVLKGEYGATAAPVNKVLQAQVLEGGKAITVRPADLLAPEMDELRDKFLAEAKDRGIAVANETDDALIYALFPQIGLKYLENRDKPGAFEPAPDSPEALGAAVAGEAAKYDIEVNGSAYHVVVNAAGELTQVATGTAPVAATPAAVSAAAVPAAGGEAIGAPLAGNIFKLVASPGAQVQVDDLIMIVEAMKMETEVRAPRAGQLVNFIAREGDAVQVGDPLYTLA